MKKKTHITIIDVAKTAGASVSTVSRALNNSPAVSPETKEKIFKVADQLGYSLSPRRPGAMQHSKSCAVPRSGLLTSERRWGKAVYPVKTQQRHSRYPEGFVRTGHEQRKHAGGHYAR